MIDSRRIFVVTVIAGLAGCGSTPIEDHYYSLVLAADNSTKTIATTGLEKRLMVGPIQLPAYLNRRGLVLQTDSSEVQIANHHFWAEPLEDAISKVLVRDLSHQINGVTVDRDAGRWSGAEDCRVRIEFDRFHATDRSRVVSSGRYWVSSANSIANREFEMTLTLTTSGYGHAVEKLRQSLETLATEIATSIETDNTCS